MGTTLCAMLTVECFLEDSCVPIGKTGCIFADFWLRSPHERD